MRPDVGTFPDRSSGRGGPLLEVAPAGIPPEVELMAIMVTFGPARQSSGQPVASYDIPAIILYTTPPAPVPSERA